MSSQIFSRRDTSLSGRWWWTVDRWTLGLVLLIMLLGVLFSFAASPPVADRLNLGGFHFVKRHILLLIPTIFVFIGVSLLSVHMTRRLAVCLYFIGLGFLVLTLVYGVEIKGARRWINFAGFSLQPSEFVKPSFAVLSAWMLSEKSKYLDFPGIGLSFLFLMLFIALLLMQPDFGMTVVTVATWITQLFIVGLPLIWIAFAMGAGILGMIGSYFFFPHVARRIDQFLAPTSEDARHGLYQINQSLEAFRGGGIFGRGPGEGIVKKHLPDAHADFVFAVAGEEFGWIICSLVVVLFAIIVVRTFAHVLHERNLFIILATAGIMLQFGMQTAINMGSTLHLIPTKGMTLPFLSYGGSSMLALGIAMGIVLALTRRRPPSVI